MAPPLKSIKENIVAIGRPLLPSWFVKAFIIAFITLGVGGIGAWVGGVNRIVTDANAVNRVQDVQIQEQVRRTDELVSGLKEANATLVEIRERLPAKQPQTVRYVYIPIKAADQKAKTDQEVLNGQ